MVSIILEPQESESSNSILDQLGIPENEREFEHLGKEECKVALGRAISKPTAVFPRFEVPVAVS